MTFVPHQPQKEVHAKIFKREAVLLKKLRKYPYGTFAVHKQEGQIIRVEIKNSELIKEDDEMVEGVELLEE